MSGITENTIIVKREAEERLVHDLDWARDWFEINSDRCAFRNDAYCVYTFEANDGQPWDVLLGKEYENLKLSPSDIVVTETDFLDEDELMTKVGGTGIRESLIQYAKPLFTEKEWEEIKENTKYSNADSITIMNCVRLVAPGEDLTESEKEAIIKKADSTLSMVSARRYCNMSEVFFLYGQIEENFLYPGVMEEDDYRLFEALVASYRKACVSLFGAGIVPRTWLYDDIKATEENMTASPYDYLGFQTHVFLRAITAKKDNEIFAILAKDKDLVQKAAEYFKRMEEPESDIPSDPESQIKKCLESIEKLLIYVLPGMGRGDEPRLPLAIRVQSLILSKKLAKSGSEKVPIGAFYTKAEIKEIAKSMDQAKEKKGK